MAGGRIKGLTVTIDGDTTGLSKALQNVNKEIKDTQAQLKDVDKLLKLDPGNTELLSQKQRLLGDAIGETKTKLETLKTASEQANVALANGEISQVSSITSSINRLIYDYNTGPLIVGQDEQTLGMVTYYISQKADVEGHFLMNYTASESTHLTLRFYDQGVEELYSPLEMDILEGEGSIGIPHAYLNRGVGIHGVYVTATVLSGHLDIETRGVFFTLDAGNFAEAVDDISMDVRDITMRQLLESNGPDQIWIVGIEDGKMLVSRRDYRESYTSNPVWTGVYTAGDALDAAIEFDGKWVLRANSDKYTLETEDQPWYFWIIPDGTLLAQHGEDETTRLTLDTGVSGVSACRGYSSNFYLEQDQGLVVAYIKGGKPYYIQYVYDTQLEAKRWLQPELLMNEEVLDFRVHRLNDYRLGFELTTATRNLWVYTARTYVAQAVPKESGNISLSEKTMFLYAHKDTDLSVTYSNSITNDKLTMYIYVSKPVRYFYSWQDVLSLDEESIEYDMIDSVEIGENGEGADAFTVAFGDFKNYWIADRAGRTVQRLNELYATNGQIGYVATERVDGKVILAEGIQLLKMKA